MLPNELPHLRFFLFHEAQFAELLKIPHSVGVVARMLVARPKTLLAGVVGFVHLQWKIVANENELAEHLIVAHHPRGCQQE